MHKSIILHMCFSYYIGSHLPITKFEKYRGAYNKDLTLSTVWLAWTIIESDCDFLGWFTFSSTNVITQNNKSFNNHQTKIVKFFQLNAIEEPLLYTRSSCWYYQAIKLEAYIELLNIPLEYRFANHQLGDYRTDEKDQKIAIAIEAIVTKCFLLGLKTSKMNAIKWQVSIVPYRVQRH